MSDATPPPPPAPAPPSTEGQSPPRWLFAIELTYLVALVVLGLLYVHQPWLHRLVPDPTGPVPLSIPWWGALGAITISFSGIFRNAKRWDPNYTKWHIARPFLGAVIGSVGYLVFVVVIRATGTGIASSATSRATFDLVAFLVGYREEIFRELLKKATDVLFAPGSSKPADSDGSA